MNIIAALLTKGGPGSGRSTAAALRSQATQSLRALGARQRVFDAEHRGMKIKPKVPKLIK